MKKVLMVFACLLTQIILPFQWSYSQYSVFEHYDASGYMGDIQNISVDTSWKDISRPDSLCTKIEYTPGRMGWSGVYWQYPANNWCRQRGRDLSNLNPIVTKLTFWVKGENGGETVIFKVGHDCGDSFVSERVRINLTTDWEPLVIDLVNAISGAFCWLVDSHDNHGTPVRFYLDDVQFE